MISDQASYLSPATTATATVATRTPHAEIPKTAPLQRERRSLLFRFTFHACHRVPPRSCIRSTSIRFERHHATYRLMASLLMFEIRATDTAAVPARVSQATTLLCTITTIVQWYGLASSTSRFTAVFTVIRCQQAPSCPAFTTCASERGTCTFGQEGGGGLCVGMSLTSWLRTASELES